MPISLGAALIGSAVLGAGASIISGNKAANAQKAANDQAIAEQRRQADQAREDFAPWRTVGGSALTKLSGMYGLSPQGGSGVEGAYGGYQQSPGYQFQRDEGVKAIERSAASRGQLASGASQKAIARYVTGLADSDYGQYVNQLNTLAGFGQSATAGTVASGQGAAANIANLYQDSGNARASSYANIGASVNNGINNALSAYLMQGRGGFGGRNPYGINERNPYGINEGIY